MVVVEEAVGRGGAVRRGAGPPGGSVESGCRHIPQPANHTATPATRGCEDGGVAPQPPAMGPAMSPAVGKAAMASAHATLRAHC